MEIARSMLMGLPDIGVERIGGSHRLISGSLCPICHRLATNAHHVVPKGLGGGSRALNVQGKMFYSPMIAVCGFGNASGCHGMFHHVGGYLSAEWIWDAPHDDWRELYASNSPELYDLGHWEIYSCEKITAVVKSCYTD